MKRVDIAAIIESKNPSLARRMPHFVIRAVERIIYAKRINHVLDNFSDLEPMEFIDVTLNDIGVSYELHGVENIPHDERLIFASNHPLGGLDGLILALGLSKTLPTQTPIRLIVNDILMNLEPLQPIFVPVNKHGSQSQAYSLALRELCDSPSAIITFPAGLCSRLTRGQIIDPPWRRNFVTKAIESQRLIIPTFISGRNSMTFYRVARWRKRLGIKANLEMILLPREMFAQRGNHVDIYFGQPIVATTDKSAAQWCEIVRDESTRLAPKK